MDRSCCKLIASFPCISNSQHKCLVASHKTKLGCPDAGVPRSWGAQKLSATLGQMHRAVNSGQMHTTHHNSSQSYDLVNRNLVVCASVTQTAILCICNTNTESKIKSVAMRSSVFGRKGLENGPRLFPRMDSIERKLCNATNMFDLAQDPA